MKRKVCVLCTGCPESRIDSANLQNTLIRAGLKLTEDFKKADLIVFRACGLTQKTAKESLQIFIHRAYFVLTPR